ncbi:MAG: CpaF family protein [Deltaproteobacteria bacterium]|nr:MAG: CpaF family protein [Deltaproteobacteria bacterium]
MTIPREVFEQTVLSFFQPVRKFLDDPTVSEVMINGPNEIWVERKGKVTLTDAKFVNLEALESAVRNLAQFVGRHVDEHRPILEARLPDGSRVEAIMPPASPDGPSVAIRRFFRETLTIERLIGFGSLTGDAAGCIEALVASKNNIIIAGGTGSGKTSLLNVLSAFIGDGERIVVIEDSRELQLQKPHVVMLEARPPDAKGRGKVSIRDLFKATLRMRPDRIVVGEIRGGEALDLVQAMTSGHGGSLCTVHATYPIDTMNRLETMALMSDVQIPLFALRAQVGSAVDIVVQTSRLQDGSRCITHITQVVGHDAEKGYILEDLFLRKYKGKDPDGGIISEFRPTGHLPRSLEMIRAMGMELPPSMYEARERMKAGQDT